MNNTTSNEMNKKSAAPIGNESGLQDKIMKQIRELGDTLERAGQKVEKSGWETIGQAIYKLGNTLEHLQSGKPGVQTEKFGAGKSSEKTVAAAKPYSDKEFDDKSKKFSDKKTSVDKVGGNDSQAY